MNCNQTQNSRRSSSSDRQTLEPATIRN